MAKRTSKCAGARTDNRHRLNNSWGLLDTDEGKRRLDKSVKNIADRSLTVCRGLERVVVDLTKCLMNRGHFVTIGCLARKGFLGLETERFGIKVSSLGKQPGIACGLVLRLAWKVNSGEFDIVHTDNEADLLYGSSAGVLTGARMIVHTEDGKELS